MPRTNPDNYYILMACKVIIHHHILHNTIPHSYIIYNVVFVGVPLTQIFSILGTE